MRKWKIILWIVLGFTLLINGCSKTKQKEKSMKTNMGKIVIELYQEKAPKTVENFLKYCESGFYKGTIFHRVIPNFMIQGGGLAPDLTKKKTGESISNEADNGLKNKRGTVAMARTRDPHSATAQFFINTADNAQLNYQAKNKSGWGYCVFGKVVEGMDVVDQIAQTETKKEGHHRNVPVKDIIIEKVEVLDGNRVAMTIVQKD